MTAETGQSTSAPASGATGPRGLQAAVSAIVSGARAQARRLRAAFHSLPGARRTLRALLLVAHGFRGEAITLRASTLTYLTLFSLVPLLAVVYAVLDLFTGQDHIRLLLSGWVNDQLGVGAGAAITGRLDEFISKANVKALGAIGFGFLLVSVLSLLWNIESAFNHIYNVRRPRAALDRLLKYWSFLTLGPALLAASVSLTIRISRMQSGHGTAGHSEVLHVLTALSAVAITYVGLALLYKVLPNAKVRFSSAVTAAFFAGTLWELAKFIFAYASTRMVQLNTIYGSVAVLPIVLTWVFISWMITLVGCRLSYALDESRHPEPQPILRGAAARELLCARVMLELGRLHRALGGPVRASRLAHELELRPGIVRECLLALQSAKNLAVEAREGGWLPGRELSQISLAELRAAARATLAHPSVEVDALSRALVQAWAEADGAAAAVLQESVAQVLARGHAETRPAPSEAVAHVRTGTSSS